MEEQKHKNQLNAKNININLNSIQEEEKIRNNKELQDNNSEDENLGYNANYNINKNGTYNIISKNSGELRLNSKESTVSTAVSQNELYLEQITSLYPENLKIENNNREINYTPYTDIGTFSIYFGCDHEDVEHCIELVFKELKLLRDQYLSDSQMRAAKKQLIGQIGVSSDNNENNALGMAKTFLHYNRFVTSIEAFRNIELLTAELLQEVAQEILAPQNLSVLCYN